jgi:hypothetical protein
MRDQLPNPMCLELIPPYLIGHPHRHLDSLVLDVRGGLNAQFPSIFFRVWIRSRNALLSAINRRVSSTARATRPLAIAARL